MKTENQKNDILNRNDIVLLVDSFYDKVGANETIGYIFNDIARINWEHHLPIMYSFWESIVLDGKSYSGNPMIKHIALNKKHSLTEEHFQTWLSLFHQTVDELFLGIKADQIKARAGQISQLMLHKIHSSENTLL